MTDTPSKPITRKRPTHYPRQIVIMATEDTYQALAEAALEEDESKSVIARRWLDAGRAAEADADVFAKPPRTDQH